MSHHEFNVIIGGSGTLGSAVLRLLISRGEAGLIATYRNAEPPLDIRRGGYRTYDVLGRR